MTKAIKRTTVSPAAPAGTIDVIGAQVAGFGYSYSLTSFASALLVVLKESNQSVLGFMVGLTGHHWVTHGLLAILLFLVIGWILSKSQFTKSANANSLIVAVIGSTIVSGLIITGFYAR